MSTDLITYLNYISTWDKETDENINRIIDEHDLFVGLGHFSSDSAIDREFTMLTALATIVRDRTLEADVIQIAADAAAIASIWSFGFGMVTFFGLEVMEQIVKKQISSKAKELNEKLTTVDTDISAQIDPKVHQYIVQYKANNDLIASKAPTGLDTRRCRSILMQFLAQVERAEGKLNLAGFKKWADSARKLYESKEVKDVYDALDKLNLSGKNNTDITAYMGFLKGLEYPGSTMLSIVRSVSISIMFYKLRIANKTIRECAEAAGLEVAEVEASAFGMLDAVGKFITAVAVVMSVVDIVFEILDIVNVVEKSKQMCDKLNGEIKTKYKEYFNGIKDASNAYNTAIGKKTDKT